MHPYTTEGKKGKRQHRDRTAEEGWWFREEKGRGAWTWPLAEDGCWGTTRGTANGRHGWEDKKAAPGWERRERFEGEEWKWGDRGDVRGTGPSRYFGGPEPSSVAQVSDMGIVMLGVTREDGGVPPLGSVKQRAKYFLCDERLIMN